MRWAAGVFEDDRAMSLDGNPEDFTLIVTVKVLPALLIHHTAHHIKRLIRG
jgi:hypothetical protein